MRQQRDDARCGARDDVGDAKAPLRKPVIVCERDALGHEARFVKQLPEPVGEAGEMMPGQRRSHARVDADEQHVDAGPDPIAQWW